jgi:hypothetical protein
MQAAAALKKKSPATLAWARLETTRPTTPSDVTSAARVGKNFNLIKQTSTKFSPGALRYVKAATSSDELIAFSLAAIGAAALYRCCLG